jgi:ATP-dependent Lon protease
MKRSINSIIDYKPEENKKRHITPNSKYKDFVVQDDESSDSLSDSLLSLTIEETTDETKDETNKEETVEEEWLPNQLNLDDLKVILEDENKNQDISSLHDELDKICYNIKNKNITLTKILKSNLQTYEKEKAVELYGVLTTLDINSFDYIQLNKTLNDMIDISTLQQRDDNVNQKLKEYHDKMIQETPTLDKIIAAKISNTDKMMAIELYNSFYQLGLSAGGLYCQDWFILRNKINHFINNQIHNDKEYDELTQKEKDIKNCNAYAQDNLKKKILNLDADLKIKRIVYNLYQEYNDHDHDNDNKKHLLTKLKWLTQLPHQKTLNKQYNCEHVYNCLNNKIYGMQQVKEQILLQMNNKQFVKKNAKILTLCGPPGIGKTMLVKAVAHATDTPFEKISFGGAIDSSLLLGSHSVWANSSPSIILQMLARQGYSDIIILLDEIDKLGSTDKGIEVQNALLQILDYTQNDHFNDAFLDDYPHNLSHIWFMATMNDSTHISSPLRDRLDIITLPGYHKEDMVQIIMKHTLPDACQACGLQVSDLSIDIQACYLLLNYLHKDIKTSGMRLVEQQLNSIVSKISFLNLNHKIKLSFKLKDFSGYPYVITKSTIKSLMTHKQHVNEHLSMYS